MMESITVGFMKLIEQKKCIKVDICDHAQHQQLVHHKDDNIRMLGRDADCGHEWGLPHSPQAAVNGWCSYHNNTCRSYSLSWHYIKPLVGSLKDGSAFTNPVEILITHTSGFDVSP